MTYPETFSVLAHKGGVGKTFTLRLLYQALARVLEKNGETRKILVVDGDPQANTSGRWLLMEVETVGRIRGKLPPVHPDLEGGERSDISDIWLRGEAPVPYRTNHPKIDVVPAREISLDNLTNPQANAHQYSYLGIREWLAQGDVDKEYCAVFIDSPPNKGPFTLAALAAATQAYIPVEYEQHPVDGCDAMMHLIDTEMTGRDDQDNAPPLNFIGICPNKVPTTRAQIFQAWRDALHNDPGYGPHMLPAQLRDIAAYTETDSKTVLPGDIFDYPSRSHSHVLREAQAFCQAVFSRVPRFADWDLDFRRGTSYVEYSDMAQED